MRNNPLEKHAKVTKTVPKREDGALPASVFRQSTAKMNNGPARSGPGRYAIFYLLSMIAAVTQFVPRLGSPAPLAALPHLGRLADPGSRVLVLRAV